MIITTRPDRMGICICVLVYLYLCICIFVYLCICVFVYLCIGVSVYMWENTLADHHHLGYGGEKDFLEENFCADLFPKLQGSLLKSHVFV